jgi:hypothetical protein
LEGGATTLKGPFLRALRPFWTRFDFILIEHEIMPPAVTANRADAMATSSRL